MDIGSYVTRLFGPAYYRTYEHAPGVFTQFREYMKHDRLSLDELQSIQIERLRRLLIHAYQQTSYYRHVFDQSAFDPAAIRYVDDIGVLPILSQDTVRSRKLELCAGNIDSKSYHSTMTGGTRGKKMPFNRDNVCRAQRLAIQWRSDTWAGWQPYERIAYLWPAIQDLEPPVGWKHVLKDHLIKRTHLIYAGIISNETGQEIYERLLHFQPALIRCFTSPAVRQAQFMEENGLELPGLKGIVCTGEPLSTHQRQQIENGFRVPVFDLYASREHGTTAAECRLHHGMHIVIDSVVLEILEKGRSAAPGQTGKLIITDLLNYAMPLIRYEIGDIAALSTRSCGCGLPYPLLENVTGRTADGFFDRNGTYISTIALGTLVDDGPSVGQVQFVQEDLQTIVVRIGATANVDESMRRYYRNALFRLINGLSTVRFEIVDHIPTEASGKYRFAVSKL